MARTALVVKTIRRQEAAQKEFAANKKITDSTKVYNRCKKCGKIGGYSRRFEICRICFRELASNGKIPGVTKSSW
jgi:small subunit ribosomal protein S14